ncbi:hypothetical protein BP6252_05821 [Coleophoma cylindrospora]|uniref:Rhodopsin domain-containing protein n=1 Tax=Coleophoma cylindrospora TaxID=1849047 RepID=A0A3D8RUW3_9HELO|nr:hypothetical protein BP6252_05821 [Coleophoma cylindrospora]
MQLTALPMRHIPTQCDQDPLSFMNIVAHVDTNLMLPSDIANLTPQSIKNRIYGSKLVLVVEQSMIMTTWGCKICLLLIYYKLTFGLKQQLAVKILGAYVVITWIVMESLYFGYWCRPFYDYWAVPTPNVQCSTALHHLIMNAVFNISSDLLMLCIPLPIFLASKLPPIKKLVLCGLFGMGAFVILCAALNKYYSFAHPFSPMWTFWYIREASTAILVANMPMCWTLMRRLFNLRAFNATSQKSHTNSKSATHNLRSMNAPMGSKKRSVLDKLSVTDQSGLSRGREWWDGREGRSGSQEDLVTPPGRAKINPSPAPPLEIWASKEFDVVDVETTSGGSSKASEHNIEMFNTIGGTRFQSKTVVTARHSDEEDDPSRSRNTSRPR